MGQSTVADIDARSAKQTTIFIRYTTAEMTLDLMVKNIGDYWFLIILVLKSTGT